MWHRHLRFLAILAVTLAGSFGARQHLNTTFLASAQGAQEEGLIQIPLRWCAVDGSTAAVNPGSLGEPDTDSVLLKRQERASDLVLEPGALITLRGAFTTSVTGSASFPIIADPKPPRNGRPDHLGDIVDPRQDVTELNTALASCRNAWDAIATQFATPLVGPIALNIGQFVDLRGNPVTDLIGWGGYTTWAPKTEHPCDVESELITASGGFFAVADFSEIGEPDTDAKLVAHELGHVLYLSHGNGEDDNGNGFYDQRCDPWELPGAPPETVMHPDIRAATDAITPNQGNTSRKIASVYIGSQVETDGGMVNGPTLGDQRADGGGDVDAAGVDLTYVELAQNQNRETVTLTQGLLGLVYPDEKNEYFAFIDLDNDPTTGGEPGQDETLQPLSQLNGGGPVTLVTGIELVTRVVVEPNRRASVTVWRFDDGRFVDVTDERVEVQLTSPEGGEQPTPLFDVVTIDLELGITNTIEGQVNIQTVATDGQQVDVLPGEKGAGPSDQSTPLYIVAPEYPDEG